jgi:CBS domain-containing protein
MLDEIWVRDCMTREVVTCAFDTTLEEVVQELRTRLFSCLVVVDDQHPIGIITERDLVGIFSELLDQSEWRNLLVEHYMTRNPRTLYEDVTLMEAVDQMRIDKIRHAPIVNSQNHLVGILTQTDVIRAFYRAGLRLES